MDKRRFCRVLAEYLVKGVAMMSICLEMKKPDAEQWAEIRSATPVRGYPTVDEAEKCLLDWFGEKGE